MADSSMGKRHHGMRLSPGQRIFLLMGFFIAEISLLAVAYQFLARIECQGTGAEAFCFGLRGLVARAMGLIAVAAVLAWARPGLIERLFRGACGSGRAVALHFAGVALMAAPLVVLGGADLSPIFAGIAPFWIAGAIAATAGAVLWIAPWPVWRAAAGSDGPLILAALVGGLLLPDLANLILPLWDHWPWLTHATFEAVAGLLTLTGAPVHADPTSYVIGVGNFFVHIAQACSGVEGLALVTGFTVLYAALMGRQLHMARYWLVVLPLGLLASWLLNVLRIAALIVIGERISPDLAVNGFHSYAGWFFFTLLALGLMGLVQASNWLHRDGRDRPAAAPIRSDWLAARILPFIAFMLVSTVAAALFIHPELGYPLKALVMAAVLLVFLPVYRGRDWRVSLPALLAGGAVGVFWVVLAPEQSLDGFVLSQLLTGLSGTMLAIWIAARVIGTIALVPLIEELFFRGYILTRLDRGGLIWRVAALAVSSLLFGLLHGRLIEASLAGVVFGLLVFWRGRLADAVWAHVAANAVVAAVALARGDWALI